MCMFGWCEAAAAGEGLGAILGYIPIGKGKYTISKIKLGKGKVKYASSISLKNTKPIQWKHKANTLNTKQYKEIEKQLNKIKTKT